MFEKADERERSVKHSRRIKIPGAAETFDNTEPLKIARDLRAKSKFGKREAKLEAAARKAGNGR